MIASETISVPLLSLKLGMVKLLSPREETIKNRLSGFSMSAADRFFAGNTRETDRQYNFRCCGAVRDSAILSMCADREQLSKAQGRVLVLNIITGDGVGELADQIHVSLIFSDQECGMSRAGAGANRERV